MGITPTVRIFGIPVSIGWGFVLLIALLGLVTRRTGIYLVEWVAVGTLAILLHELGHALAFRRFGVASRISFWGLGGLTAPDESADELSHRQQLIVSAFGPLVGIVLGGAVLLVRPLFAGSDLFVRVLIADWILVNLGWAIFNLLPIGPLDGGRVLGHLLGAAFGERGYVTGQVICVVASLLIAAGAYALGNLVAAGLAVAFGVIVPVAGALAPSSPAPPSSAAAPSNPVAPNVAREAGTSDRTG